MTIINIVRNKLLTCVFCGRESRNSLCRYNKDISFKRKKTSKLQYIRLHRDRSLPVKPDPPETIFSPLPLVIRSLCRLYQLTCLFSSQNNRSHLCRIDLTYRHYNRLHCSSATTVPLMELQIFQQITFYCFVITCFYDEVINFNTELTVPDMILGVCFVNYGEAGGSLFPLFGGHVHV